VNVKTDVFIASILRAYLYLQCKNIILCRFPLNIQAIFSSGKKKIIFDGRRCRPK